MGEWINGVSDWVSAHLPEVIAIVTSGTFVGVLTNFLLRLWLIKIQSKVTKKNNEAVIKKYETLESIVLGFVNGMEAFEKKLINEFSKANKEQLNEMLEQQQKSKQKFLNAILDADKETEKLIEQAREISNEIKEEKQELEQIPEESNENTENIENIAEIEPESKEVEQKVKPEENTEESEYIVVEKLYEE